MENWLTPLGKIRVVPHATYRSYRSGSQSGLYSPWGAVELPKGSLEVGSSERVVRLFTIEVTSDQTSGNWYHFIKPIHRIKHLLTVKHLLNVLFYCYYLP
jgi:hypothetical protein